MASLLKRSRMFTDQVSRDRLKAAISVVALEVAGERLQSQPTTAQLEKYRKRQAVSRHWLGATDHWANDVGQALASIPELDQFVADLARTDLDPVREDAMDQALLAAVRSVYSDYLEQVSL